MSKQGLGQPYYSRAIAWLDSSGAYLNVHVNQMNVKTTSGVEQSLEFLPVSLDTVEFTPDNAWNFLASSPALLPADAESLVVDFTLSAENLEKVGAVSNRNPKVSLEFKNAQDQALAKVAGPSFATAGNISETTFRFSVALNSLGISFGATPIKMVVKVEGLNPRSGTFASLGHIYDFTKQLEKSAPSQEAGRKELPLSTVLLANYPNPFNPETTIKYQIPKSTHVTLKIYNLLGQEIRTLVDEVREVGSYAIRWDGKNDSGQVVASGIYLYQIQAGDFVQVKKMAFLK